MLITKADGTQETFKPGKLRTSLKKAGAARSEIDRIVGHVESTLKEGARTQTIYREAFALLSESEDPVAAKYSLRRAIFGLGPTGFPFEDFLARLFESEGYRTRTRLTIRGKCAIHEVDVAAFKKDHSFVAEAKFHMRPGIKSDLQVVLYSYARYLDLKALPVCKGDTCGLTELYVVTNTKFTHAAINYARCSGLSLLSWNYPHTNSLQSRIDASGLYPITALTKLSNAHKVALLEAGIILCRDIMKKPDILSQIGLQRTKIDPVLVEARLLCGSKQR